MRITTRGWAVFAVLGVLACERPLSAEIRNWQGGTAAFEVGSNWYPFGAPNNDLTTDVAKFSNDNNNDPSLGSDRKINGLIFAASGLKLKGSGRTLSIGGGGIDMSGGSGKVTIETNVAVAATSDWDIKTGTLQVTGTLSGSANFSKSGTGTLSLAGENGTYSGMLTVNGGTLQIDAHHALAAGAIIDLSAAGSLNLNGKTLACSLVGKGKVLGGGTATGTVSVGHSPGTITFTGDTTLSGVYEWELAKLVDDASDGVAGTDWDLMMASGLGTELTLDSPELTFKNGSLLPDDDPFWRGSHDWMIARASSGATISGGLGDLPVFSGGTFSSVLADDGSSLVLHWEPTTHAPEPGTLALIALAGPAAFLAVKRRQQRH